MRLGCIYYRQGNEPRVSEEKANTTARNAYDPSSAEWSRPLQSGTSRVEYCKPLNIKNSSREKQAYLSVIKAVTVRLPRINYGGRDGYSACVKD
jgi:hypothetical protein